MRAAAAGIYLLGSLAALAALAACDANRVLAFASPSGVAGNTGTGGGRGGSGITKDAGGGGTGTQSDAGGWTPFGKPQIVTGLRSDADAVLDPSMTFEGLELYFASPTNGQTDIWVSTRTVATDPWGPSTMVAELSSPQNDQDPEVSVDGLTMYLASDRVGDGGGSGMRIYVSQRRTRVTAWQTPTLVSGLGSSTLDEGPGLDRTELNLAFASERGTDTQAHLFTATRPDTSANWQNPTALSALNSAWEDTDPALFSNGSGLVFSSRRLTQGGTSDLFQAARPDENSPFQMIAPISELNTSSNEEGPWMSQDGTMILFASDRSGTMRIYQASR
jgi:Tol biopolymer transport system component